MSEKPEFEIPLITAGFRMTKMLDEYHESISEYHSRKAAGAPVAELSVIETKATEQRESIQKWQPEFNRHLRLSTFQNLHTLSTEALKRDLRRFGRWSDRLPQDRVLPAEHEQPFVFWRKCLDEVCIEIEDLLNERGESTSQASDAHQHAARVASQVQSYLETVRLLGERGEEDIAPHPQQEAEIRRV